MSHTDLKRNSQSTEERREDKCADEIGTVPVPGAGHFQWYNINIFFK